MGTWIMILEEAKEAQHIVDAAMDAMLMVTSTRGRTGADLRTACNDLKVNCLNYLYSDTLGPPLVDCFNTAVTAGINSQQMLQVTEAAKNNTVYSIGALVVRDSLIELSLASIGLILMNMTFRSKEDVDAVKFALNDVFNSLEEVIADDMDGPMFEAVIKLHSGVIQHLVKTAYPLPQILEFRFAKSLPSLVIAYRLYANASRADELREQNKVVHPAFMLPYGLALSR
jgi:prophage DNA circulation protein